MPPDREQLALAAMQGLSVQLGRPRGGTDSYGNPHNYWSAEDIAKAAYRIADAMLKLRGEETLK